ncbi:MAG: AmmeMemoRadiSam system protein A [Bacteroidetes bacterium]|nr:AmmeMemoRadiSam system protein A [Bacteroidota bacterium]
MTELTFNEKRILLSIARAAIARAVGKREGPVEPKEAEWTATLRMKAGVFVTLELDHRLRGCVGYVQSQNPLAETVKDAAVSAALHDNRFTPVVAEELDRIEIEISVLTPMKKVTQIDEIVPGEHGLLIEKGYRHGLLLPQVATEYGWIRETFLEQTCIKAGLGKEEWRNPDVSIYSFTALVFHENELGENT